MSFSAPRITIANSQATMIGPAGLGSITRRFPSRIVGTESISRFSTKYEAKKMQRKILATSTGWPFIGPMWTHSRAPLMFSPKWGTRGTRSSAPPARTATSSGSGRGRVIA